MPAQALNTSKNNEPEAPAFYLDAHEQFVTLVTKLRSESAQEMTLKQLEDLIWTDGFEAMRLRLQSHINERVATTTVNLPVTGSDLIARTHQRLQTREVETLFGTINITRTGYGRGELESLHPFDASLNLPAARYSHAVRQRAAEAAAKNSFDEVVAEINQHTGAHLPNREAQQIVQRGAQDFDAFYPQREVSAEQVQPQQRIAHHQRRRQRRPDAQSLLARSDALIRSRRASRITNIGAAKAKSPAVSAGVQWPLFIPSRRLCGCLSKSQASCIDPRTPCPSRGHVLKTSASGPASNIRLKRSLTRHLKKPRGAIRNTRNALCALVDGNQVQLQLLQRAAKDHQVELTMVLDLIHVIEYLWDAARALYHERDPAAEAWVSERLLEILRGKSSLVAAGIRRRATLLELNAKQREPIDKCADYLLKYRAYLHDDQYLAAGLPIATGVIEGACRYLVKDRLEKTGARWSLEGAEAVLRLRALRASGDFDEYWKFHLQKEYERQYISRYADGKVPELEPLPNRSGKGSHLRLVKG
jgi:hypothetical protein